MILRVVTQQRLQTSGVLSSVLLLCALLLSLRHVWWYQSVLISAVGSVLHDSLISLLNISQFLWLIFSVSTFKCSKDT